MGPYFGDHTVTLVLFLVTVVTWIGLELRQSVKRRAEAELSDRGSYFVARAGVGAGWIVAALSPSRLPGAAIGGEPVIFAVGFVVAWAGIGLRWWAFHTLGRYFTFRVQTSPDQPVISNGPYRVLRHPGYAGVELVLIGMGLLYDNWIGVAATLIFPMLGLANRIRVEERALNDALGEPYRAFASTRKRMIPFVW
jgi:protein-S-isoprenylcysteine O-methyltransferase Ste14